MSKEPVELGFPSGEELIRLRHNQQPKGFLTVVDPLLRFNNLAKDNDTKEARTAWENLTKKAEEFVSRMRGFKVLPYKLG